MFPPYMAFTTLDALEATENIAYIPGDTCDQLERISLIGTQTAIKLYSNKVILKYLTFFSVN